MNVESEATKVFQLEEAKNGGVASEAIYPSFIRSDDVLRPIQPGIGEVAQTHCAVGDLCLLAFRDDKITEMQKETRSVKTLDTHRVCNVIRRGNCLGDIRLWISA